MNRHENLTQLNVQYHISSDTLCARYCLYRDASEPRCHTDITLMGMYCILNYMKTAYHIFLQELLKLHCQLLEWRPVEREMTPASAYHIKPVTTRQPFHWIRQQSNKLVPFTVSPRGTWAHYCKSLDKTSATCVIIKNTAFKENYFLCIVRQKHILRPSHYLLSWWQDNQLLKCINYKNTIT